jgi:hypothetical protein
MGIARYIAVKQGNHQSTGNFIFGLAVVCASYAYYTLGPAKLTGISPLWFGLWGNLLVILAACAVCWALYMRSLAAALLVAPAIV